MSESAKKRKRKPFSEEARKNISEARKGIKLSEEHKKNLSKATSDYYKRKNGNIL
jgi:hypothetical protein